MDKTYPPGESTLSLLVVALAQMPAMSVSPYADNS